MNVCRGSRAMRLQLLLCWLACGASDFAAIAGAAGEPTGSSQQLRTGWRFARGDHQGAEAPAFDDSSWQPVRVPHDWAIAGPFDPNENGYAAKLPWRGIGWYRRNCPLDCPPGSRVYLDFDGVMAFPKVYVNGQLAGDWDYGYTPFRIDATDLVNLTGPNTIAIRVDTTKHGTRWYPGAGIYRNVTLQIRGPIHLAQWGTFITTPQVTDKIATVRIETTAENHSAQEAAVNAVIRIHDPDGKVVAAETKTITLAASGSQQIEFAAQISNPQRWDVDSPRLYTLETTITSNDKRLPNPTADLPIDRQTTSFGIRTCEFTADDGFHLNGRRVQIHGVNLHHDQGPLGAAFNKRAMQRQLEIMRDMGVNAIRTSHNPPATEMLDLCDRLGFVVWDECFDKWNETADRVAGKPSHEAHAERHLRSMVLRDRNHPSIITWSIGNEIPADRQGVNAERVAMMREVVRKYDTTRPVGMGCDNPDHAASGILAALDLTGWNYARRYARYRENYPTKPILYSESASALSTRGFYDLPLPSTKVDYSDKLQVDSYDLNAAPWSDIADAEFRLMHDDRFVGGEFVWTGFDYLGEPTPFTQHATISYFGIVDLCGLPKDRYFLYRSHWRPDTPTVHIVPHWNWPERLGKTVPVFVYTNGDSAELFLNGKSLGKRTKGQVPKRSDNLGLAAAAAATATSSRGENLAKYACDGDPATAWSAASDDQASAWEIDLGESRTVKTFLIQFKREANKYTYVIQTSLDHANWQTVAEVSPPPEPVWGGPREAAHACDTTARYIRIAFPRPDASAPPGINEVAVYPEETASTYYDVTYAYRLRWDDVTYQPGELKTVAYKGDQQIGTATQRTAGAPAALRLTADRRQLVAADDDLSYLLVEAVDADGNVCPLAQNEVRFHVEGAGEIAAVGNGDPLSLEPFQADHRKLFFGKALLIVRSLDGQPGEIKITARGEGLKSDTIVITSIVP